MPDRQTLAILGARGHLDIVLRELPDLPHVDVVAVSPAGADEPIAPVLERLGGLGRAAPRVFDEVEDLLDQTRPDLAVVCGAFERHAEHCVAALRRGVHVYSEKPVALTLPELEAVRAACAGSPATRLSAMMQLRYAPGLYTAWTLVRDGAVGDVRLVDTRKSYKLRRRPAYYTNRATYGGTIPWVGSHAIDWARWLFGGVAFESVFATHSTAHNGGYGTMEATAACLFTLAGGRAASVSIDYLRPESAPTHGDDWFRVVGSAGVIEATPEAVRLLAPGRTVEAVPVACDRRPFADFCDHAAGRAEGLVGTSDMLAVTEACLLARQSADERRVVAFPSRTP